MGVGLQLQPETVVMQPYGPKRIFRPRREIVAFLQAEAKFSLGQRFKPGSYVGKDQANPIIKNLFQFYDQKLREFIPLIASRDLVDFLLFQYDETTDILHGNGILDLNERRDWQHVEPLFRRAIKYIVELVCIEQKAGKPRLSKEDTLVATEIALVCAETAADLAEMSNRVFGVFPNDCLVIVHEDFNPELISIEITGKYAGYDQRYFDRVRKDRESRDRFIKLESQFDVHTDRHAEYLDAAFLSSFGISYALFIAGIRAVIEGAQPAGKGHFPTLFIRRNEVIRQLGESGRPPETIEAMLRGFTVLPEELVNDNRVLWNAKQQSRAYRRGFFSLPDETGEHLAFSRDMAKESMVHLVTGVCFQKLPREWMTSEVSNALAALSNAAGDWFEEIICENLRSLGYEGGRVKGALRKGLNFLAIPSEVGDLDFLGFNPIRREILLVEAKMTSIGLDAQFWRDDIQQFVSGKKPYADQLRRKRKWVMENLEAIQRLVGAPSDCIVDSRILTLYPCIATEFIGDLRCESITEFILGNNR